MKPTIHKMIEVIEQPSIDDQVDLISIDQASTSGITIWSNKKIIKTYAHTFKGNKVEDRLCGFRDYFSQLFLQYQPKVVVFEEILNDAGDASKGFYTQKALSYFQGILIELCQRYRIHYEIYVVSAWRKTFGVRGRTRDEQKKSCQAIVNKRFSLNSEDACDSVGIGYHFYNKDDNKNKENEISAF